MVNNSDNKKFHPSLFFFTKYEYHTLFNHHQSARIRQNEPYRNTT